MCTHGCVCECESITYARDVQQYLGFCWRGELLSFTRSNQAALLCRNKQDSTINTDIKHILLGPARLNLGQRERRRRDWKSMKGDFCCNLYSSHGDVFLHVLPSVTGFQERSYFKILLCSKSTHFSSSNLCFWRFKEPSPIKASEVLFSGCFP